MEVERKMMNNLCVKINPIFGRSLTGPIGCNWPRECRGHSDNFGMVYGVTGCAHDWRMPGPGTASWGNGKEGQMRGTGTVGKK
jgi:hypothetical protein